MYSRQGRASWSGGSAGSRRSSTDWPGRRTVVTSRSASPAPTAFAWFETGDWHEVFADVDYTGTVYGLSFARSGQLAVAAFDGGIRLYGADLRPVARAKAPGGGHSHSIAFLPSAIALPVVY